MKVSNTKAVSENNRYLRELFNNIIWDLSDEPTIGFDIVNDVDKEYPITFSVELGTELQNILVGCNKLARNNALGKRYVMMCFLFSFCDKNYEVRTCPIAVDAFKDYIGETYAAMSTVAVAKAAKLSSVEILKDIYEEYVRTYYKLYPENDKRNSRAYEGVGPMEVSRLYAIDASRLEKE